MNALDASPSDPLGELCGLRLGKCARRIVLLAPRPGEEPSIIRAERPDRAAQEAHRRAMRRLAAIGLVELTWKREVIETKRVTLAKSVEWDAAAGVYREAEPGSLHVERAIERRAVRLTALGTLVVDRLRPVLEKGKQIRWAAIAKVQPE